MRKAFYWILVVVLVFSVGVFPSCTKGGDGPDNDGKKALLIILDGWGIGDKGKDDVISQTATPYLADVAPSILHIMGLKQPVEMTGNCLIKE